MDAEKPSARKRLGLRNTNCFGSKCFEYTFHVLQTHQNQEPDGDPTPKKHGVAVLGEGFVDRRRSGVEVFGAGLWRRVAERWRVHRCLHRGGQGKALSNTFLMIERVSPLLSNGAAACAVHNGGE